MKWLLGTYKSRFNRRHNLFGHLFSGRYKSLIVDGSGSGYLKSVGDYVHLNPARAELVVADVPLKSFAWSSWPAWLWVDRLLGEWGMSEDSPAGRQRLEQALEERRGAHFRGRSGLQIFFWPAADRMRWRHFCRPFSSSGLALPRVIQSRTKGDLEMPDVGRPCANQPGSQSARLDVTGRFFQAAR
jgi:hypothetical protein